jgi:hypothetical protein
MPRLDSFIAVEKLLRILLLTRTNRTVYHHLGGFGPASHLGDAHRRKHTTVRHAANRWFRPQLETLEDTVAPSVTVMPMNLSNQDGDTVNSQVMAWDSTGDPLSYQLANQPPGITINSSGVLVGTIAVNNSSTVTFNVTVTATDTGTGDSDTEPFTWTVAPSDVVVQNTGTGYVRIGWDQTLMPMTLMPNQSMDLGANVTGLTATLLTSGASYQLATNAGFSLVNADNGVAGVQLTVDTTQSLGKGFVGTGDIGEIDVPGAATNTGPSLLNVSSRNDVGTITGAGDGTGVLGGTFSFTNLTNSITGFDHVNQIAAGGLLGTQDTSAVYVNHGIDSLQATGVNANVDTTLQFTSNDASSDVTIGTGGITQTMTLGNVSSFTDSGNINTIQVLSLNGDFNLGGNVVANQVGLGQAENARVAARQATIATFYSMPNRIPPRVGAWSNWNFTNFAVNNIGWFTVGTNSNLPITNNPGGAIRVIISGNMTLGSIGRMTLYGRLEASNIFIGSIASDGYTGQGGTGNCWFVSGISNATANYTSFPNDAYAIFANGFLVGQFEDTYEQTGDSSTFRTTRSDYIRDFEVMSGNLQILFVGGTDTSTTYDFLGTIHVHDGNIRDIAVQDTLAQGPSRYPADGGAGGAVPLVEASGSIDQLSANTIGVGANDIIQAKSIGTINLPTRPTQVAGIVRPGTLNAQVLATGGSIAQVSATDGTIAGSITAQGGDIRSVQGRSLLGNVVAQRDRNDVTDNNGGNIWSIAATGAIGSDGSAAVLIRADNGIGTISAATMASNVNIILQMGGSVQGDGDDATFVIGGPLQVSISNGAFFPQNLIFTYGVSDPSDPFDFQAPAAAWKVQWTANSNIMEVVDNPGQVRAYYWSLTAPANAVLYGMQIPFTQVNGGNVLALDDPAPFVYFDGDPNGVAITFWQLN